MTESPEAMGDDARWYDEHRDDLLQWSVDPPPENAAPKRRRGAMVSARFTAAEVSVLRAAAGARGVTLSALVRDAALEVASSVAQGDRQVPTMEEIRRVFREELANDRLVSSPSTIIEFRQKIA